jgi:hypothetical protein
VGSGAKSTNTSYIQASFSSCPKSPSKWRLASRSFRLPTIHRPACPQRLILMRPPDCFANGSGSPLKWKLGSVPSTALPWRVPKFGKRFFEPYRPERGSEPGRCAESCEASAGKPNCSRIRFLFCSAHGSVRIIPAMKALTGRLWSIGETARKR